MEGWGARLSGKCVVVDDKRKKYLPKFMFRHSQPILGTKYSSTVVDVDSLTFNLKTLR